MVRKLLHTVLFLVGLLATSAVIRCLDEVPFSGILKQKLLAMLAKTSNHDTICLGSSRVHRGFLPAGFDTEMAKAGIPTHSLNLGIAGMQPHGTHQVFDWVIEHRHPSLRQIFVEAYNWNHERYDGHWMTAEETTHFDVSSLPDRLVTSWQCEASLPGLLSSIGWTLTHTIVNYLRIGHGPKIVNDHLWPLADQKAHAARQLKGEGFEALSEATAPDYRVAQHRAWRADDKAAKASLAFKTPHNAASSLPGFRLDLMRAMVERAKAAGIRVTFVAMPNYGASPGRNALASLPAQLRLIDLDVVAGHEELFRIENWFDAAHVGLAGASELTRLLAAEHAKQLRAEQR